MLATGADPHAKQARATLPTSDLRSTSSALMHTVAPCSRCCPSKELRVQQPTPPHEEQEINGPGIQPRRPTRSPSNKCGQNRRPRDDAPIEQTPEDTRVDPTGDWRTHPGESASWRQSSKARCFY